MVLFLALIIGPSVIGDKKLFDIGETIPEELVGLRLVQPNGLNNDNTNGTSKTGTGADGYSGALLTMRTSTATDSDGEARNTDKIKLF